MVLRRFVWVVVFSSLAAALLVPLLSPRVSNCGGNSAALSSIKWYLIVIHLGALQRVDRSFLVTSATPEQREELSQLADDMWIGKGRYLVSVRPYKVADPEPPHLVIVCNKPFTNVPRRLFGRGEPKHAAGFSDGRVVLLSESEYATIDHSSLVLLDGLLEDAADDR